MPKYLVKLAQPVVYQPDHPKARRTITELEVSAGDPKQAEVHVYRTTQGTIEIVSVEEVGVAVGA